MMHMVMEEAGRRVYEHGDIKREKGNCKWDSIRNRGDKR